ncbi:membrane protein insertase YidC [Campylobacter sp. MIT 99-7217]|uniref:membrane protein insertase YidC n=1 Tax=Campylobacter sp. MIT 99-7217 TaxID=535091 RepID=UPI00115A2924|nr:membrane protein insertase YidC [Campylobacter sp. MIT 99-7217]TQR34681.1 membrane protein insertase YidC [Campylobacter sp. MIT 99-7217]
MNNQNNPNQQKRIILAVALSFLFFIVYSEFFVAKVDPHDHNSSTNTSVQNPAPNVNLSTNTPAVNEAPIQEKPQSKVISTIESEYFKAQFDEFGRIASFKLKGNKFKDEKNEALELISSKTRPLEIRFSNPSLNNLAFSNAYTASEESLNITNNESVKLILTQNLGDLTLEKIVTFYEKGNYDLEVKLSEAHPYFISTGSRPESAKESYVVRGALLVKEDETIETFEDKDVSSQTSSKATIISAFDAYYASLFYDFDKPLDAVITDAGEGYPLAFAQANGDFKAKGYIGAKEHSILKTIDKRLILAVEYGWFTFIAKPVYSFLEFLHDYIGNWGWSIVALTLIIRVILFPLTYRSMISMNKLKDLAPKMKELRERYKGDPQKMNVHMMELYKKHGANPFSGCLPILLQIPIFFAIYRVLLNAVELKGAAWALWIYDLSVLDPYYVLPILMGATMFLQQLITPMAIQDPTQAKIMKFLPVIFTFFFLWFPAGLTLYWCVNNLCSLLQQWVVNKLFAKEHHKKEVEKEHVD